MVKLYGEIGDFCSLFMLRLREKVAWFYREEKGDLVASLGWMAIMALVLVVIKGIVDGRLTTYANTIFNHLYRVFGP